MDRRKRKNERNDDIDAMLRRASRPHARALSRILFGIEQPVHDPTWIESQLAARQRRVDRVLAIRIGDEHRWQHIEWSETLDRHVLVRIYEYNHLLAMAAQADADAASKPRKPPIKPATVDSVVVVLTGPKSGLPRRSFYRTSSPNEPFSGVHFRVESVYRRTVAEIEAMNNVFWLVFVPLAIDADELAIVRAIDSMRTRTNRDEFGDLVATLFTIARLKKDRPEFMDVIQSHTKKRKTMLLNNWLIQGRREGRKVGEKVGERKMLRAQFERRLQRPLTPDERTRFTAIVNKDGGAQQLANAVVDLSNDQLEALLAKKSASLPQRA